jgi:hypothetical protein
MSETSKTAWHRRHDPRLELWLAWYAMVFFYNLFGVVFVLMTHVMPPPQPGWDTPRVLQWFADYHTGLLAGFGIIFLTAGLTAACNALIGYSMRRMSVSPGFAKEAVLKAVVDGIVDTRQFPPAGFKSATG